MNPTPAVRLERPPASGDVSAEISGQRSRQKAAARPRPLETILWGGLIAGLLDGFDAMVWVTANGVSIPRLFQYIASGLIGLVAFKGGWASVLLGIALHFLIATSAATAYYLLSLKLPILLRRPFVCGPAFGIGLYILMHYFVLPLSAVPSQPAPSVVWIANQLFSHTIFVGLPIALIARRSATVRDAAT